MDGGQDYYFILSEAGELQPRPEQRWWLHTSRELISRMLNLDRTDRLLDIGCGEGYFTLYLAPRASWTVGIDLSAKALRLLNKQSSYDRTMLELVTSSAAQLPLADETFDKVVCHHVLEHVIDDSGVIKEIYRVLRRNGKLVIGVPQVFSLQLRVAVRLRRMLFPRSRLLVTEKIAPGGLASELIGRQTHIRFYSIKAIRRLLEVNGFHVEKAVGIGLHTATSLKPLFRRNWLLFRLSTALSKRFPQLASDILVRAVK
jgi:ubiquinone/menaquinone biosynthesis C-methylase UbiE